jgi:hypothetical protein
MDTGSVLSAIGLIINMTSAMHVKKAGLILAGNSVILPLGKKRK